MICHFSTVFNKINRNKAIGIQIPIMTILNKNGYITEFLKKK